MILVIIARVSNVSFLCSSWRSLSDTTSTTGRVLPACTGRVTMASNQSTVYKVAFDFNAEDEGELTVRTGEMLRVAGKHGIWC